MPTLSAEASYIASYAARQGLLSRSQIHWALDGSAATVQNMCIDHCGANVLVSQQLLNTANVISVLQKVCGAYAYPWAISFHAFSVSKNEPLTVGLVPRSHVLLFTP